MADELGKDKALEVIHQRDESQEWLENSYWPEWEKSVRNYQCRMKVRKDADGKDDETKSHIAMPDTFAGVNRRCARITANLPDISFTALERNAEAERAVSRKIMWDWDVGGVQRGQKRHARQGELFGWSVRSWWWEVNEHIRRRGVDVRTLDQVDPKDLALIAKTYDVDPDLINDPQAQPAVIQALMANAGKRGLLDVEYLYKAYEGPRSQVMFVGDCYPSPFFERMQECQYFIVERRRDEDWLKALGERYPQCKPGLAELLDKFPKGTQAGDHASKDYSNLRDRMLDIMKRETTSDIQRQAEGQRRRQWTITERWIPGYDAGVRYVGEGLYFLGDCKPYDLDGQIPFTELVLLDDVLGGIGDAVSRVTQGLQDMHNLTVNSRFDLVRAVTNPLLFTTDRSIWDNPLVLRRDLFRMVLARGGPNSVWNLNDGAALQAISAAMGEEGAIMRMFQTAFGDSNMSMAANVDPAQVRTATGARMLQANQDVLTKDLVDMYNFSVSADATMIYLLNRSEMADAVEFDPAPYERNYDPGIDRAKLEWIKAEPMHFQLDGRLICKLGSTLADDDEALVAKSTNLFQMLNGHPMINQSQLVQDLLISHGHGPELNKYMQPQTPPPPEPPIKGSLSVTAKMELLPFELQQEVFKGAGLTPPEEQVQPPPEEGAPPPPAGAPAPANGSPPLPAPPAAGAGGMQ